MTCFNLNGLFLTACVGLSMLIAGVESQSSGSAAAAAATEEFASSSQAHGVGTDVSCYPLAWNRPPIVIDLSEGSTNCFALPSASSAPHVGYRIEITHPTQYGRFSIFQQLSSPDTTDEKNGSEAVDEEFATDSEGGGFAWGAPADGIFYCAPAGSRIMFEEYPPEATVTVRILEPLAEGEFCESDFRSYCGDPVIDGTTALGVWYTGYDYYLRLEGLEANLIGAEETITLEGLQNSLFHSAQSIYTEDSLVGQTIMFTWANESGDKNSLKLYLNIDEAMGTWFIVTADFTRDDIETGFLIKRWAEFPFETCYHAEKLEIFDRSSNEIRLLNFTLAPFLPWKKINGFDQMGIAVGVESSTPWEEHEYPNVIGKVIWMTDQYFLHADHFEYQVKGEFPVTMEGVTDAEIRGDPGNSEYQSIEIMWHADGKQRRLFMYISAEQGRWKVFEARVYDQTEEWRYFYPEDFDGEIGVCFQREEIIVSNSGGDEIRFSNVSLATFLPWPTSDTGMYKEALDECIQAFLSNGGGEGWLINDDDAPSDSDDGDDDAPSDSEILGVEGSVPAVSCRSKNCEEMSHEGFEEEEEFDINGSLDSSSLGLSDTQEGFEEEEEFDNNGSLDSSSAGLSGFRLLCLCAVMVVIVFMMN